jgi:putative restriction endonuclease
MRYWWVNQNQTFRHEIEGGYIWSPKKNKNEARNQFYENMREVSPGDLIFSFKDTQIQAIGIAESYCHECPKPVEFGTTGSYWQNIGWKVKVRFTLLSNTIRPKAHIELIRPFLPSRYSPLLTNGNGLQSVYLASVNNDLAGVLVGLIGAEAKQLFDTAHFTQPIDVDDLYDAELQIEQEIIQDNNMTDTERLSLVRSRVGQGLFKKRVSEIETHCRITGVDNPEHLTASHCKPWRDATNEERLNGENGLLLTPSIDHLFDRGFIGFENNGELIISPVAHRPSLQLMGIETEKLVNVGAFTQGQKSFLEFHRDAIFLQVRGRR